MIPPLSTLGHTTRFIFANGLYYDADQIELTNQPYVIDHFLSELIRNCKRWPYPLTKTPINLICRSFKERYSANFFDPNHLYCFDAANGYLWENETVLIAAYSNENVEEVHQVTGKIINLCKLTRHPFATALSAAIIEARNANQNTVNLENVFQKAISGTALINAPQTPANDHLELPENIPLSERWRSITGLMSTLYFLSSYIAVLALGAMPWLCLPMLLFSLTIYENIKLTRQINIYMRDHRFALQELGLPQIEYGRIRKFIFPLFTIGLLATLFLFQAPALAWFASSVIWFPIMASSSRITTITPMMTTANLMLTPTPPLPDAKIKQMKRSLMFGAGSVTTFLILTLYVPMIGLGFLSIAVGPVGIGVIAALATLLLMRLLVNQYNIYKLHQLHPQITELYKNRTALTYTPPEWALTAKPKLQIKSNLLRFFKFKKVDLAAIPTHEPTLQQNSRMRTRLRLH